MLTTVFSFPVCTKLCISSSALLTFDNSFCGGHLRLGRCCCTFGRRCVGGRVGRHDVAQGGGRPELSIPPNSSCTAVPATYSRGGPAHPLNWQILKRKNLQICTLLILLHWRKFWPLGSTERTVIHAGRFAKLGFWSPWSVFVTFPHRS